MEDYPRYLLLGKIGNGKPILHFNGHYDVVPAGSSWDYEPFNPAVVNNRIYGRGSSDMKGGMVSVITTLKALLSLDIELNGSLEISMTPDEEIGGMCGAKYLLEKIDVPNWVIIPEPSGYDTIFIGHKGVLWGEITVHGKSVHASMPWNGINAIEKATNVLNSLLSLKTKIEKITTSFNTLSEKSKRATLSITVIEGGIKTNVIPDKVSIQFDRRILPEENPEKVIQEINTILEELAKKDPEMKFDFKDLLRVEPSIAVDRRLTDVLKETIRVSSISPLR